MKTEDSKISELENKLQEKNAQIAELENSLRISNSHRIELKKNLHEVENKLRKKESDIAELENSLRISNSHRIELKNFKNRLESELRKKTSRLAELEARIADLKTSLEISEVGVRIRDTHRIELKNILHEIEGEKFYLKYSRLQLVMRLLNRYDKIIEKLLPPATRRRHYYELMLAGIRVILNEGWRSFFRKVRERFAAHKPALLFKSYTPEPHPDSREFGVPITTKAESTSKSTERTSIHNKIVLSATSPKTKSNAINKQGIICIHPFTFLNFSPDGNVSTCPCPHHLKYRLGNIKHNSIAEIWNSDTTRWIRRKMYAGEWQDICKPICPFIIDYRRSGKFIKYEELKKIDYLSQSPGLIEEIKAGKDYLKSPPVCFQPDISANPSAICNLHCIMCDVHQTRSDPAVGKKLWADLKQYLPTAKYIMLAGWGEPFVRPESKELLLNYHGPAKFHITTNGLLLPKYWEKIKHQKIPWLKISVDAATQETYEKIRMGAKWGELLAALNLIEQNRDKFPFVMINMTVMRSNYKEIPQFIDLAESYGFDCLFHPIHSGKDEPEILWGDENIFELNDTKALAELKNIVINENSKKRRIGVRWLSLPYYLNN